MSIPALAEHQKAGRVAIVSLGYAIGAGAGLVLDSGVAWITFASAILVGTAQQCLP